MAEEQTTQQQESAVTTDDATGATEPNSGNERRFTQADLDDYLKVRLEKERGMREKAAEAARLDAEAKSLIEQQKFKELADQRELRIKELEPVLEQNERLTAALKTHLDTQRADLPEHIIGLLDRLDTVDQLEWLATNRSALTPTRTNGVPPTPRGDSTMSRDEQIEAAKQSLLRSGNYGI